MFRDSLFQPFSVEVAPGDTNVGSTPLTQAELPGAPGGVGTEGVPRINPPPARRTAGSPASKTDVEGEVVTATRLLFPSIFLSMSGRRGLM